MLRWIAVSALASLLSGCVTTTEHRYYDDGYYDSGYRDAYGNPVPVDGSTYYSPSYSDNGDYYYGVETGYSSYGSSNYIDYPYYYSVFWPLNRWSVDPYWHPGFYYGVTYYPRNYFSIGFSRLGGWHGGYSGYYGSRWGSYYAYSPYRQSWVDHYYDWTPWYNRYPASHYNHYSPRYGNPRHEAQLLSRQLRNNNRSDWPTNRYTTYRNSGLPQSTPSTRYEDRSRGAIADRHEAVRGADYGGRSNRTDPQVSGFGYRNGQSANVLRDGSTRGAQSVRQPASVNNNTLRNGREYLPATRSANNAAPRVSTLPTRDSNTLRQNQRDATVLQQRPERSGVVSTGRNDASGYQLPSRPATNARPVERSAERIQTVPSRQSSGYDAPVVRSQPQQSLRQQSAPTYRQQEPTRQAPVMRSREAIVQQRPSAPAAQQYQAPQRSAPTYQQAPQRTAPTYQPSAPQRAMPSQQAPVRNAPAPARESRESARGATRESSSDRESSGQQERRSRER